MVKKAIREGTIKKLRCVKFRAPTDRVDGLDEGHEEVPLKMEVVLSANEIPIKDRLKEFFNPDTTSDVKSLVELRDFNFSYDTVKVEVDVDGSIKTFDLGSIEKIRTHYDITEEVKLNFNQQPTFDSIKQVAERYLHEIIDGLYP